MAIPIIDIVVILPVTFMSSLAVRIIERRAQGPYGGLRGILAHGAVASILAAIVPRQLTPDTFTIDVWEFRNILGRPRTFRVL